MKTATLPRQIFKTKQEPRSPKSMLNSIFDSTAKKSTSRHWSYRSHARTPKMADRVPHLKFIKGVFHIGAMEETFPTIDAAKLRLKELGYLRFYWMGAFKMVG